MKIIVIGLDKFDCLEWNLVDTFKQIGYNAEILDPFRRIPFRYRFLFQRSLRFSEKIERIFGKSMLRHLKKKNPDIIISTIQDMPFVVTVKVKELIGCPIIQWNPDPINSLVWNRERILQGQYDLWVVEDPYVLDLFEKKLNLPTIYIPEAINARIHVPPRISKREAEKDGPDILIAGVLYPYRALILENFIDYQLEIYGPLPKWLKSPVVKYHQAQYITGLKKSKMFYSSKICLNTVHYTNFRGTNCRMFEVAGAGGFQIMEYKEEVPKFFQPDKEIVLYSSLDELKEKVDYYLKHPEKRWAIAKAGRERALKEHTWKHRVRYLLSELKKRGLIKNEKE